MATTKFAYNLTFRSTIVKRLNGSCLTESVYDEQHFVLTYQGRAFTPTIEASFKTLASAKRYLADHPSLTRYMGQSFIVGVKAQSPAVNPYAVYEVTDESLVTTYDVFGKVA